MMRLSNRIAATALAAVMAVSMLTACGGGGGGSTGGNGGASCLHCFPARHLLQKGDFLI